MLMPDVNILVYAHRQDPTPLPLALAAVEQLSVHPRCRLATPSATHLNEVVRLCRAVAIAIAPALTVAASRSIGTSKHWRDSIGSRGSQPPSYRGGSAFIAAASI